MSNETPFAQLFTDLQAGKEMVQWHKSTPVSDEERNKLRTQKRAFGLSLITFPLILAVMYSFVPHLFYTAETGIQRNTVAMMVFGFIFSSGSTLWLIQRINRSLNQPLHTAMPNTPCASKLPTSNPRGCPLHVARWFSSTTKAGQSKIGKQPCHKPSLKTSAA